MSPQRDLVAATRRHLEASYGLALEGLTDDQVASAIQAAWRAGSPADPGEAGWLARVVDRLPIDESWLFREDDLWTWLRDEAGPALLARALSLGRPVRILSLGCSAGQEPFSLAILFQGLLEATGIPGSAAAAYVTVTGIDSSPGRVELARSGAVNGWSVQRSRRDWLRERVRLEDPQTGRHRVDPGVLSMCRFEVGNLVELAARGNAALGGADLVLCRNVLIYFRPAEAERIAAELGRGLDPGAILAFSAAEAHLLAASGCVTPLGLLGAGRAGAPLPTPPPARRAGRRRHRAPAARPRDPHQLFPRLIVAEQLMQVDAERGRTMLQELLAQAARLPPDATVPLADGLSVAQVADAARLLLADRGTR